MQKNGDLDDSSKMPARVVEQWPRFGDAYLLLGDIYQRRDKRDQAITVYRKALDSGGLSFRDKRKVKMELDKLESSGTEMKP